jgi:hypothetical protein
MAVGKLQHALGDILMSAFAMFHLKDSSLLMFRQRMEEGWANMDRVYKIKSIPKDTAKLQALDKVTPNSVSCLNKEAQFTIY